MRDGDKSKLEESNVNIITKGTLETARVMS